MKKLMISSLALLLATASMQAQNEYATVKKDIQQSNKEVAAARKEKKEERKELRKLEGKEVTYQSKQQFGADFGNNITDVTWKRTKYFDEATFMLDGKKTTAYYDIKNELVGTTQAKTFADLPASAQKYINNKYKDYKVGEVLMFDDNENNDTDMLMYGRQFADEDNYFVELQQGSKDIIVQVDMAGQVFFFTTMQ
ncbi:MAG: hypothetical protein J7621_00380 [Niastella sp.]|nr:hypothetical protein [Niastella sp.]